MPVIPATWEAEENHLNPGSRSCSEPRSHHCIPAWATERDSVTKKKKGKKGKEFEEAQVLRACTQANAGASATGKLLNYTRSDIRI